MASIGGTTSSSGRPGEVRESGTSGAPTMPRKMLRMPMSLPRLASAFADVRRLGRDVRLRAARDGHQPRVLELGRAIDGAEDLLHLLLQVQELDARLPRACR